MSLNGVSRVGLDLGESWASVDEWKEGEAVTGFDLASSLNNYVKWISKNCRILRANLVAESDLQAFCRT